MLALLEVIDRDGRVRQTVPVMAWPLRLGRAIDNDVVLDDPHLAPHHAQIEPDAQGLPEVLALPGVNGLQRGKRRIPPGQRLALAGPDRQFVAGQTRLRLRLPGDTLDPERPLGPSGGHRATLAFALAFWLWSLFGQWVQQDPGAKAAEWLPSLLGVPLAVLLWTVMWTLVSKLFQHRLDFWPHLGVAARGLVVIELLLMVLPWASALSGWALPSRLAGGVPMGVGAAMLVAHARIVRPHLQRAIAMVVLVVFTLGTAVTMALNQQRLDRWFDELYTSLLPPPSLLWAPRVSPEDFVAGSRQLLPRLEAEVRQAEAERREVGDEEDD